MKKSILLITTLIISIFLLSGLVSAYGCCCLTDGTIQFMPEDDCVSPLTYYGDIQQSQAGSLQACLAACDATLDSCQPNDCGALTTNAPCDCGGITIDELDNQFCCASESFIHIDPNECLAVCDGNTETYRVYGIVQNLTGGVIVNAEVSITNSEINPIYTNASGEFSTMIAAGSSIVVSASYNNCGFDEESFGDLSEDTEVILTLSCTGQSQACQGPYHCCAQGEICVENGVYASIISGYSCTGSNICYDNPTCVCEEDILPEEGCAPGCNYNNNSFCVDNVGLNTETLYDLTIPSDYADYCQLCINDIDCQDTACITDGECDGNCPLNCEGYEDPDCGSTCNFDGVSQWCSPTEPGFILPDLENPDDPNSQLYCQHCANIEPILPICEGVEQEEGICLPEDGIWTIGVEDCDPGFPGQGCGDGLICNNSCMCEADGCAEFPLAEIQIYHVPKTRVLNITWTYDFNDCEDSVVDNFKVYRCEGQGYCNSYPINYQLINTTENNETFYYEDYNIENETYYTYVIGTVYSSPEPSEVRNSSPEFKSGHGLCLEDHLDYFCYGNNVQKCKDSVPYLTHPTEGNQLESVHQCSLLGPYAYCYQGDESATCVGYADCTDCNSIFSMYYQFATSNTEFKVNYRDGPDDDDVTNAKCSELVETYHACYPDKALTGVDQLYQCNAISSCYSYESQDSCETNYCGLNSDCEWIDLIEDLGLGVCRPSNISEQDCSQCNDNPTMFPVCNSDSCSLYGYCYFNKNSICANSDSIRCDDYIDGNDCTGNSEFNLNSYTNYNNSNSHDYFDLTKCKWDNDLEKCYKDANDNEPTFKFSKRECGLFNDDNAKKCLGDFQNPSTLILKEDGLWVSSNFSLPYMIYDNAYSAGELETSYCLTNASNPDFCKNEFTNDTAFYKVNIVVDDYEFAFEDSDWTNLEDTNEQNLTIFYFSKDTAENLEHVKSFNFSLDNKGPSVINFSYNYSSYEGENEIWYNDVNASITYDENVTCNFKLFNSLGEYQDETHRHNFMRGTDFNLTFNGLVDDTSYRIMLGCVDKVDNPSLNESLGFGVEGDLTITNVTPKFETGTISGTNSMFVTADTINNATCGYTNRYGDDWNDLEEGSGESDDLANHIIKGLFDSEKGKHHETTVTFAEQDASGVYKLYIFCQIDTINPATGEINETFVKGNEGDTSIFGIDMLAPVISTMRVDSDPDELMDFTPYYRPSVSVILNCFELTLYNANGHTWSMHDFGFDANSGCEGVMYCSVEEGQTCIPELDVNQKRIDYEVEIDEQQNYDLRYYGIDKNGYTSQEESGIVKLDNADIFLESFVTKQGIEIDPIGYGNFILNAFSFIDKNITNIYALDWYFNGEDGDVYVATLSADINSDGLGFTANFIIDQNNSTFYDESGTFRFVVDFEDEHGFRISQTLDNHVFDTKLPTPVTFDPIFKGGNFEDYPFKYFYNAKPLDGTVYPPTYFSKEGDLFITGNSDDLGTVTLYLIQEEADYYNSNMIYDLTAEENRGSLSSLDTKETSVTYNGNIGTNQVVIKTIITGEWTPGKYISFLENKGRTSYGNFGQFYNITAREVLTALEETRLTFEPPLEEVIGPNQVVYLYNESHKDKMFGIPLNDVNYSATNNNSYMFRAAIENTRGIRVLTDPQYFFIDNESPKVRYVYPTGHGTIANENQAIGILIQEHAKGSGINEDSVKLSITSNGVTTNYTQGQGINFYWYNTSNGQREYWLNYTPSQAWSDGEHSIAIFAEDFAGNELNGGGFFDTCFSDKDACCSPIADGICDKDCGIEGNGSKIFPDKNFDPDCTSYTSNHSLYDACNRGYDNVCDLDCYVSEEGVFWDGDCYCDAFNCAYNQTNHAWCYYGEWHEAENQTGEFIWVNPGLSQSYCDTNVCGTEDTGCFECNNDSQGFCDLVNGVWCNNNYWTDENYNEQCGNIDSNCIEDYGACEEDACDQEYNKVCDENGYWNSNNWDSKCVRQDADILTCTAGDCDPVEPSYCINDNTWTDNTACLNCIARDYDCFDGICVTDSCNVDVEMYCGGSNWTNNNYENNCGNKDLNYGCEVCIENTCDVLNNFWCHEGNWTTDGYCSYGICQGQDPDCAGECNDIDDGCCSPLSEKCDPDCTEGQDAECAIMGCTKYERTAPNNNCCVPDGSDDFCDKDCTITPDPECADDWVFTIDKDAPSKPEFKLYNVHHPNPDPHYRWVIDAQKPSFSLNFSTRFDGSTETLNIEITNITVFGPTTDLTITCSLSDFNIFNCNFNKNLEEGLYNISVKAHKKQNDGNFSPERTDDFELIVDRTIPIFEINVSKSILKVDEQLEIIATVFNEYFDLLGEITVQDHEPIYLEATGDGTSTYNFIVPPESNDWGLIQGQEEKSINVKIFDYAGHMSQQVTSVIVDNESPSIYILDILAEIIVNTGNNSATVGSNSTMTNLTIIGGVSSDAESLCQQSQGTNDCLFRCLAGEDLNCISSYHGFQINTQIMGVLNDEALKNINLSVTDYAGYTTTSSLFVLLDLQAPSEPEIRIAGAD